jgi:hypothetical protein
MRQLVFGGSGSQIGNSLAKTLCPQQHMVYGNIMFLLHF